MKFQLLGASSPEESVRERAHRAIAREAAAEGIVLLENNGVLPMQPQKIALYGAGSRMTVKGGSGSGDVHERYSVTIEEGLKNAGFAFPTTLWMDRFQEKYEADIAAWRQGLEKQVQKYSPVQTMQMFIFIGEHPMPYPACTPVLADELTDETDTAIYVLSRQAGEGKDRRVEKGDYLLSNVETESLRLLRKHYKKLMLILNCGGVMDLSILDEIPMDAVLFFGQGGMEGGNALADILTGKTCPSGCLTDTWAIRYDDYPSADTFSHRNGDLENEEYAEDIYVGYRWFDKQGVKPRYPFGYGLSYTDFSVEVNSVTQSGVELTVTNTGGSSGKKVLQIYVSKPEGALEHEVRALVGFAKTKCLGPGQRQTLSIPFRLEDIASFDESRSAFVLEAGEYRVKLNDTAAGSFCVEAERVLETVESIGTKSGKPVSQTVSPKAAAVLKQLGDRDKIRLVVGGGYDIRCYNNVMGAAGRTCTKLLKKGIPNIAMSDGPAGLNVNQLSTLTRNAVPRYPEGLPKDWQWGWLAKANPFLRKIPGKGKTVYRYMTAWPSETVQAQTWNTELLEEIGKAVGREMLEIGVSVWLAPGLNIHRNPLCGRNFEYYSEDPYLTGKIAAAAIRGIQSTGRSACPKHFACNNQETRRNRNDSRVSERALREIYLKGFEIAIRESAPLAIMTSYNKVNGVWSHYHYELATQILRQEWGYQGLVITDWWMQESDSPEFPQLRNDAYRIRAQVDVLMPGEIGKKNDPKAHTLVDSLADPDGVTLAEAQRCAGNVLRFILKIEGARKNE